MSYATGPYSTFDALPAQPRPVAGATRKIDFARRRYTIDATTGGLDHMSTVAQLACMAVAYGVQPAPAITTQEQEATRQAILAALAPYADLMPGLDVVIERSAPGVESRRLTYRDASTGLNQTVQLP